VVVGWKRVTKELVSYDARQDIWTWDEADGDRVLLYKISEYGISYFTIVKMTFADYARIITMVCFQEPYPH